MNVTLRKASNSNKKDIDFEMTMTCDPNVKKVLVNKFFKTIIFDIKEINLVKNDIGFLLKDIYPMLNSLNIELDFAKGRIFYCWVCLKTQIFAFDLMYLRKDLKESEIKNILNTIKLNSLYCRKVYEKPVLPFNLTPIKQT